MAVQKKKTLAKKPKSKKNTVKRAVNKNKKNNQLRLFANFLISIALLSYVFLSFYSNLLSYHGVFIKNIFMGIFGNIAYVIPFTLIFSFIYYLIQRKRKESCIKIYTLNTLIIFISVTMHLIAFGADKIPIRIEDFYNSGVSAIGGGVIGGFIGEPLKIFLSFTGAMIFSFLAIFLMLILLFNEFAVKLFDSISKSYAEHKKETKKHHHLTSKKKEDIIKDIEINTSNDDNFNNIMKIFNEYENVSDTASEQQIEDAIKIIDGTEAEHRLKHEQELIDKILKADMENDLEEVLVDAPPFKPVRAKQELEDQLKEVVGIKDNYNEIIEYIYPSVELLEDNNTGKKNIQSKEALLNNAIKLENTLRSFNVEAKVVNIEQGPTVTRYELQPQTGVKISKIMGLQEDIALNLAAKGIRIAPIPGKTVIGVELANEKVTPVFVKEVINSKEFFENPSKIDFAVGKDTTGKIMIADIGKMPHVLIAGATGSGKSVCINSLITSLLFRANPNEVKLILIDPKVVELGVYNGIPHLLIPVVTDPKKAAGALHWAVVEMTSRYKLFAENGVRDIKGYNLMMESNGESYNKLPQIVIIIDELADLMMVSPKDVEEYICRLAQLARAAGMHLVVATQRPSVDVITGLIKANIPSRIAFAVSSQVDSRTILDMAGAEKLLGKGDMLYYPVGEAKPLRVQGSLITDKEVERIVNFVKASASANYNEDVMEHIDVAESSGKSGKSESNAGDADELLVQAIETVVECGQASTSMLQRRLKLGYARAARIVDQMEERGIVGPSEGSKPRQILITKEQLYEMKVRQS